MNITGCVFNGRLLTSEGTYSCSGFVGWWDQKTANISNSLYAPNANITPGAGEMAINDGATFIRDENSVAYSTCYYTETLGVAQGTQAYAFSTAPANLGSLVQNYGMMTAYENGILYDGKYYVAPATISLANAADNTTTITAADGYIADVTLNGRTLYKDGAWNTICLPFNVTLAGSPLADAVARPLNSASISGSTLTLTFGDAVTTLKAGTPYIIKWAKADGYDEASEETRDLKNPVFSGVTIDKTMHNVETDYVDFKGQYDNQVWTEENTSILFVGDANYLYFPQPKNDKNPSLGACRAYFQLKGITAGELPSARMVFSDETTEIRNTDDTNRTDADCWYTIDGRKLDGKPTKKGLYIHGGRKTVVK
jgi:hypothetical protein